MATSAEAEVQKIQALERRIKAPSIWGRVPSGLRFEDLQERRYEDTVRLLKKHYLPEEITFRSVKIADDKEGVDEFTHNLRIWMKDKMSIAVVKEATDKLVGCLIMRIQEKMAFSRTFSRTKITYNEKYSTVMQFYNKIEEPINLFETLGVKRYMKMYILALKSRYRHRGVAKELIKAAMELAASGFIPALTGIFLTGRLHSIADELGFQKFNEIYYTRYYVNHQIAFWDIGVGNYGGALFGYRIPTVEEPVDIQPQSSSRFHLSADFKLDDDTDDQPADTEGTDGAGDSEATPTVAET